MRFQSHLFCFQNMLSNTNLISSNFFTSLPTKKTPKPRPTTSFRLQNLKSTNLSLPSTRATSKLSPSIRPYNFASVPTKSPEPRNLNSSTNFSLPKTMATSKFSPLVKPHNLNRRSLVVQRCGSTIDDNQKLEEDPVLESEVGVEEGRDWTTSILLFVLWGVLIYYVFNLAPNQTPSRDMYFLKKLLYLKGDDGFKMNEVLVSLWYMMGLWPLVYSMILLPTGRSSKSSIPVWPFLILSCFGGVYVLLPYFVVWKPPPPPVEETELSRWPLNFLESKLTAGISLAAGLGLIVYAALAGGDAWQEFYQYIRESKFIHITSIDFSLLSAFAPFWVYNDMTARKWYDKGSWLLPISMLPLIGPALYLLLRPSLSEVPALREASSRQK